VGSSSEYGFTPSARRPGKDVVSIPDVEQLYPQVPLHTRIHFG